MEKIRNIGKIVSSHRESHFLISFAMFPLLYFLTIKIGLEKSTFLVLLFAGILVHFVISWESRILTFVTLAIFPLDNLLTKLPIYSIANSRVITMLVLIFAIEIRYSAFRSSDLRFKLNLEQLLIMTIIAYQIGRAHV